MYRHHITNQEIRLTENAPILNNYVVGAGKHVINDIENSLTQKIKHKKTYGFLLFVFSRYGFSKNKLVCGFSKHYII